MLHGLAWHLPFPFVSFLQEEREEEENLQDEEGGVRAPTSFSWSWRKSKTIHSLTSLDLASDGTS